MKSAHLHTKPVNSTAARVISKGTHYTPKIKTHPGVALDGSEELQPVPTVWSFVDLSNQRIGQFNVRGYLGDGKWLVECLCGVKEKRRTKALRDPGPNGLQCTRCHYRTTVIKRRGAGMTPFKSPIIRESPPPSPLPTNQPQFVDYTGRRIGSLVVHGFAGKGRWWVRCDCGNYERRGTPQVARPNGRHESCDQCDKRKGKR